MQHTVAAVFDNYNKAQQARDDLLACGFSSGDVHLNQNDEGDTAQYQTGEHHEHHEGGIIGFFKHLFGDDDDDRSDAALYSEAVRRGNYVLTVDVPDDDQIDRATEVLDRHHPVDIDEQAAQWRSGAWASQDSMRQSQSIQDTSMQDTAARNTTNETRIPVVEEELQVGKRTVQRGGVRVYQRVTEQPVHEQIRLREEHVNVERRPMDQPANAADLDRLQDKQFEVRETAEEPVIAKQARVVEEVVVKKDVTEREQDVNDTVRRTDVEVEKLAGQNAQMNQDRFRTHWNTNYAQLGGTYDDYAPAYLYGTGFSSDKRYTGRSWADIENDARSGWETQYPSTNWDNMRDAVRYGYENSSSGRI